MSGITIRLADASDFDAPTIETLRTIFGLLTEPMAHREKVLEIAGENNVSYSKAFEFVEDELERVTGKRHYPEGGYGAARVSVCRIMKRERCKIETTQLSLDFK